MAGVRDPAFWKRFSLAVHLDEEHGKEGQARLENRRQRRQSDGWLAHQQRKKNKRTKICWIFWICFILVIGSVIGVIAWLGAFDGFAFDGSQSGKLRRMIRLLR